MATLSWFFGNGVKAPAPAVHTPAQSDGDISYDANLIGALKENHDDLLEIFNELNRTVNTAQYFDIPRQLRKFKTALQVHAMTENVMLYAYLEHMTSLSPVQSAHIRKLRKDMDGIPRAVVEFVNAHSAHMLTDRTISGFISELRSIGDLLLQRVELEETSLYPLYAES